MYESYFNLQQAPFRLTPNPGFFFNSSPHKRGLAFLHYAFQVGEGFVVVTGSPGTGKTELLLRLVDDLSDKNTELARIVTSNLDATEMLKLLAASFRLPYQGLSKAEILTIIEQHLMACSQLGKRVLILIDEAHSLSLSALTELSMLANFQLGEQPLLQCFLLGQESLNEKINDPSMVFFKQRVIASTHLNALSRTETQQYIEHRLKCAGWQGSPKFCSGVFSFIHDLTGGVPRRINNLANRVLLQAYLADKNDIDRNTVQLTINEMTEESFSASGPYKRSENYA